MRLLDYSVWLPGLNPGMNPLSILSSAKPDSIEVPKLAFLPLMQRRRLSSLGRVVLSTLYPLFDKYGRGNNSPSSVILASRWGDIQLTVKALEELSSEKTLSPTGFSTSVHNAIGGLFSMFAHFTGNITSMAAGENTIDSALTEAKAQLVEYPLVFVSIYEDKTPEVFDKYGKIPFPFAVTLVLSNETDRDCALAWKEHLVAKNVSDAPILTQLYEFLIWLDTERRHEGE